jgi:thymidylate synthase (FAD)
MTLNNLNLPQFSEHEHEHIGTHSQMPFRARLVTSMGDKLMVVNAARASFNKLHEEFDEVNDIKLLNYLASHWHTMPWRHLHMTMHFRIPEAFARQMFRHIVGIEANVAHKDTAWSEMSGRYVPYTDVYIPPTFHYQHKNKKQGASSDVHERSEEFYYRAMALNDDLMALYNEMIEANGAREEARIILPMGLYTEFYWTASIQAIVHFVSLRAKPDAQAEIRDIADYLHDVATNCFGDAYTILYNHAITIDIPKTVISKYGL